ncbi:uncharacterized protein LOC119165019 [Rhipicephalus microplus]|uniref:uncharacterized protein LOC119165019 n=1 Tax=Rhipicephalus microplus TaxID=6941 RepID=UPI003F6A68D4
MNFFVCFLAYQISSPGKWIDFHVLKKEFFDMRVICIRLRPSCTFHVLCKRLFNFFVSFLSIHCKNTCEGNKNLHRAPAPKEGHYCTEKLCEGLYLFNSSVLTFVPYLKCTTPLLLRLKKKTHRIQQHKKEAQTSSSSKMSHQQYHSLVFVQDRLHSCRQCTYVTKYKTHMRTHLLKHLNQHPYECHLCPATFAEKFKLTLHVRAHTGKRPFPCNFCNASFSKKDHLLGHICTHTGERPFSCDYCSASFSKRSHLSEHVRTHTGERPYSCTHCNASFSRMAHLKYHVTHRHAKKL